MNSIGIFRRVEQGADAVTLLMAEEERQRRLLVSPLYTSVPNPVKRIYRRTELDALKRKTKHKFEQEREYEAVLRDPHATEEDKRLARMVLVAMRLPDVDEDLEVAS